MFAKTFRNTLIASTLVVAGSVLAAPAMAQTAVPLSGTVTTTLSLTSTATTEASTLTLSSGTEQIVHVSDLVIHTNNDQGYTLTATSGSLTKTGGSSIPYQVVVVDGVAPATGDFSVASGTNYTIATTASNAAAAGARDLYVKYTPNTLQDPGTYTGSITLTVADNP